MRRPTHTQREKNPCGKSSDFELRATVFTALGNPMLLGKEANPAGQQAVYLLARVYQCRQYFSQAGKPGETPPLQIKVAESLRVII